MRSGLRAPRRGRGRGSSRGAWRRRRRRARARRVRRHGGRCGCVLRVSWVVRATILGGLVLEVGVGDAISNFIGATALSGGGVAAHSPTMWAGGGYALRRLHFAFGGRRPAACSAAARTDGRAFRDIARVGEGCWGCSAVRGMAIQFALAGTLAITVNPVPAMKGPGAERLLVRGISGHGVVLRRWAEKPMAGGGGSTVSGSCFGRATRSWPFPAALRCAGRSRLAMSRACIRGSPWKRPLWSP